MARVSLDVDGVCGPAHGLPVAYVCGGSAGAGAPSDLAHLRPEAGAALGFRPYAAGCSRPALRPKFTRTPQTGKAKAGPDRVGPPGFVGRLPRPDYCD